MENGGSARKRQLSLFLGRIPPWLRTHFIGKNREDFMKRHAALFEELGTNDDKEYRWINYKPHGDKSHIPQRNSFTSFESSTRKRQRTPSKSSVSDSSDQSGDLSSNSKASSEKASDTPLNRIFANKVNDLERVSRALTQLDVYAIDFVVRPSGEIAFLQIASRTHTCVVDVQTLGIEETFSKLRWLYESAEHVKFIHDIHRGAYALFKLVGGPRKRMEAEEFIK